MEIVSTTALFHARKGSRTFLSLHERKFVNGEGNEQSYFMVTRGEVVVPSDQKKPDAVIIVATTVKDGVKYLIATKEFRIPLGCVEVGFPAGLIDPSDMCGQSDQAAAEFAAERELREETGYGITAVTEVSPPNLYSSAGMTNESARIVFCEAVPDPAGPACEPGEQIEVLLLSHDDLGKLLTSDIAHSKSAWPLFWAFHKLERLK